MANPTDNAKRTSMILPAKARERLVEVATMRGTTLTATVAVAVNLLGRITEEQNAGSRIILEKMDGTREALVIW